ncbi:MAG: hypothetical protein ACFFGZ_11160 [Candidatus Thorarchaeota archaeon]
MSGEFDELIKEYMDRSDKFEEETTKKLENLTERAEKFEEDTAKKLEKVNEEISELRVNQSSLKGEIESFMEKKFSELSATIESGQQEIETGKELIEKHESRINEIEAFIQELKQQASELLSKTDELEKSIQEQKGHIEEKMAAIEAAFREEQDSLRMQLKSDIDEKSSEIAESIGNLSDEFTAKIEQETSTLTATNENLSEQLDRAMNDLHALSKKLGTDTAQIREQIDENKDALEQKLNAQGTDLNESITGLTERLDEVESAANTRFEELQQTGNQLAQSLETTSAIVLDSIDKNEKEFERLSSGLKIANEALGKYQTILENYSETIDGQSSAIDSYRQEFARLMDVVKAEEQDILQAFQRMLTGSIENTKNDMLMVQRALRKALDELRGDIESSYLLRKDHERLVEQFRSLEQDLRTRAEESRQELVRSLEQSVKEFQSSVQESIESVRDTKTELSEYKDEISSLVERKVNEKYDFAFDLIGRTLTKSEELVELVAHLQLPKAPRPAIPIASHSLREEEPERRKEIGEGKETEVKSSTEEVQEHEDISDPEEEPSSNES